MLCKVRGAPLPLTLSWSLLVPKIINVTIFSDPGHGWGAVSHEVILELGIAEEISVYSYMSDSKVFLEEDSDFGRFLIAADKAGWRIEQKGQSDAVRHSDSEWLLRGRWTKYPVNVGLIDIGWGKALDTATGNIVPRTSIEDAPVVVRVTEKYANNSSKIRSYGRYAAEWVGKLKIGAKVALKSVEGDWVIVEAKGRNLILTSTSVMTTRYRVPKATITDYLAEVIAV